MLFSNWFAIVSNAVTAITCGTICLLLATQLRHDRKAMRLAFLMLSLAGISVVAVIMRGMAALGQPIHVIFIAAVIMTGMLPMSLYLFVHEYLEAWTPTRRVLGQVMLLLLIMILALLFLQEIESQPIVIDVQSAYIAPNGEIMYGYGPLVSVSAAVILYNEVCLFVVLYTVIQHYFQQSSGINRRITFGIVVLTVAIIIVPIPGIEHYAFEQLLYTVGALALVEPVLGQRLFDPLQQLNRQLAHRAEQLALITRVGQDANSLQDLKLLLPEVAQRIRNAFDYRGVEITVRDRQGHVVGSGLSRMAAGESPVHETQFPRLRPARTGVVFEIPLEISAPDDENPYSGTMVIEGKPGNHFSAETREVLHILARQIANAIRNAQLYQELRWTNRTTRQFVSYSSHELRNGIINVVGLTDSVLTAPEEHADQQLPDAYVEDLQTMLRVARYLKLLLDDIVDWSQIENGQVDIRLQAVDPLPILTEVAGMTARIIEKGVAIRTDFRERLPQVSADPLRLKQILLNLLGNAVKFTEHGSITLSVREEEYALRFTVSDTGPGIPAEAQPHLFLQFDRNSDVPEPVAFHRGLGLSICAWLIQMHRGRIWVESAPDQGTAFHFTIPLGGVDGMMKGRSTL